MPDISRITAQERVGKLMDSEHADLLREGVAWLCAELMEAEVAAQIGGAHGERSAERITNRNGYRPRGFRTRVGESEFAIPKLRAGTYFPSFLESRTRGEQSLVAVVQEAYANGVSTRKVDQRVQQLGLAGMSERRAP